MLCKDKMISKRTPRIQTNNIMLMHKLVRENLQRANVKCQNTIESMEIEDRNCKS